MFSVHASGRSRPSDLVLAAREGAAQGSMRGES